MNRILSVLNFLTFLLVVFAALFFFRVDLLLSVSENLVEKLVLAAFLTGAARLALSVASAPQKLQAGVLAALAIVSLWLVSRTFLEEGLRFAYAKGAFEAASDDAILTELTANNKYYVPHEFIQQLRREIPPEASILYLGDQRPDPLNYLLYPRRVYTPQSLQMLLNQVILRRWSEDFDPGYSESPVSQEAVADELRTLLEGRQIDFVVEIHSLYPERNRFWRLR